MEIIFYRKIKDIQGHHETLIDKDKRQKYNQEYDSFYKKSNTNSNSHSQKPNSEFSKSEAYNVNTKPDKKSESKTSKTLYIIIPILIVIAFL